MAYLKIYRWENLTYRAFYRVQVNEERIKALVKKLSRHFKVWEPNIQHVSFHTTGRGEYGGGWISLNLKTGTNLSTVIHEFAHHLEYAQTGKVTHRKTFVKRLKKVYTFAKRYLPVAQPEERKTSNLQAEGSSPSREATQTAVSS